MRIQLFTQDDCGLCDAWKYELLDLAQECVFLFEERSVSEADLPAEINQSLLPIVVIYAKGDAEIWLQPPASQSELRQTVRRVAGEDAPS